MSEKKRVDWTTILGLLVSLMAGGASTIVFAYSNFPTMREFSSLQTLCQDSMKQIQQDQKEELRQIAILQGKLDEMSEARGRR